MEISRLLTQPYSEVSLPYSNGEVTEGHTEGLAAWPQLIEMMRLLV